MVARLLLWSACLSAVTAFSSDLNFFHKRANSSCDGSTYKSPIGLSYSLYCNTKIPTSDITASSNIKDVDDIYDCIAKCSVIASIKRCTGVLYFPNNGTCTTITTNSTNVQLVADSSVHSAVLSSVSQLAGSDTTCPYTNGTSIKTYNGMEFRVACGVDIYAQDYCPYGNITCPNHASSLLECMNYCSESHALCAGVSYNPDGKFGYGNCYLKYSWPRQGFLASSYIPGGVTDFVTHSAVATVVNGTSIPVDCTDGTKLLASNNETFVTNCNKNLTGDGLPSYHATSLDNCVDSCANYKGTDPCIAVVYDAQILQGWQNCYLRSSTKGTLIATQNITLALLSTASPPKAPSDASTKSASKAWIAGPVVGAILAIVLLLAAGIWYRRRKRQKLYHTPPPVHHESYEKAELPNTVMNGKRNHPHELYVAPGQLHGSPRPPVEMQG